MTYSVLLTVSTLASALIIGLGLANGGNGGAPYWPVVAVGIGYLLMSLFMIVILARRYQPAESAEDIAVCKPCREGEHCEERGPDCGYGCACPCPRERRNR